MSPARPIAIIGLGNEIAGDDGAGIVAAGKLATALVNHKNIEVIALPWAGFALLEALSGRQQALIIDCLASGRYPAGTVVRLDEDNFRGSVRLNSFHDINYPTALSLGRQLGWPLPETVAIWAIEGDNLNEFTERLTPAVAAAVDRVVREILDFLGQAAISAPGELPKGAPAPLQVVASTGGKTADSRVLYSSTKSEGSTYAAHGGS